MLLIIIQQTLSTKTFKDLQKCAKEPYFFLTIDITLPADDSMKFRKNFSDSPL